MRGSAPAWPTVDPERLRSWSDVETWDELDYMLTLTAGLYQTELVMLAARR